MLFFDINWVEMIIYWVTDLSRKVLPVSEIEILKKRLTTSIKWWFTILHLDEKKKDLMAFWRNATKPKSLQSDKEHFSLFLISN